MSARDGYPDGIPPAICDQFEQLALAIRSQGWKRYSADALLHRIRFHWQIERGDRGFKADNNWTAPLARWFLARHPDAKGFFELRIAKPAPIRAYID
jgi:hypothetical protein